MNNDLISREALKEDLIKFFPIDCLEGIESKTLFNQILTDINNAPTVDTTCPHCNSGYAQGYSDGYLKGIEERPQGEWIEFARWVAKEVLDNYFEESSGAFAEIACRKLVKLGLVEINDNVYKMKGGAE